MANNLIQFKRTSTTGLGPNTTNAANNAYIPAGSFAVNLTDKKVFGSDGTNAFDVGSNVSTLFVTSNAIIGGRVGIVAGSNPVVKLHVGNEVVDDNNYAYDANTVMFVHQAPTAAATLNDPKETLILARQGTASQAYGAAASFDLSRYENGAAAASRTRLDIKLADGNFLTNSTIAMTMLSSGNVGISNTAPRNKFFVTGDIGLDGISVRDTATTTTTATTQITLFEYPVATYDSCEVLIKAVSGGERHVSKLLVTANSTVAIATEYGILQTGSVLYTVDTDIAASNTRIRITPASATSTVFKASYELITA